jgi:hypothetical protein
LARAFSVVKIHLMRASAAFRFSVMELEAAQKTYGAEAWAQLEKYTGKLT